MAIFNPREAVRKLRDRNFDEPQANAIVEVAEDVAQAADTALDEATSDLATREYFDTRLEAFEARMRAEFAELRVEMQKQGAETDRLRAEMYRAIFGLGGFIALVATVALAVARWMF